MAEKKETAKPEKAPKAAPKPAPKATPKAETPVESSPEAGKAPANKKINKMSLAEIDARLNEIRSSQGGLKSRYAKQLILRKKNLGS